MPIKKDKNFALSQKRKMYRVKYSETNTMKRKKEKQTDFFFVLVLVLLSPKQRFSLCVGLCGPYFLGT